MALCSPTQQLTHWVLPGPAQRLMDGHPYYLLCEAPLNLPLPPYEVDSGECTMTGTQEAAAPETIEDALQTGQLHFQLHGQEMQGEFTLARLSPQSSIWRFSVGHMVPYTFTIQA
jgi:hypothetical protein